MIQELDTRYGRMFVPDTDIGQFWWLSNTGAGPEDYFVETVCEILDDLPKGTAIDLGANFGCWSLPLSKHAVRVLSFEPQRCVHDLLKRSIEKNGIENIVLHSQAVGEYPGFVAVTDMDIDRDTNFGGIALGHVHSEQPSAKMYDVRMIRLDDLGLAEPISFIKMDIEGGEVAALRGARALIMKNRPVLFVELENPLTDGDLLKKTILDLDYGIERFGDNVLGMPL